MMKWKNDIWICVCTICSPCVGWIQTRDDFFPLAGTKLQHVPFSTWAVILLIAKTNWRCWLATSMRQWLPRFTSIPLTTPMIWGYPERKCHKRLLCKEENLLPGLLDRRNYWSHTVITEMPLVQAGIARKLCPNHTSSLCSDTNQWDN